MVVSKNKDKDKSKSKVNMFIKRAPLSKRERKYCSCLLDVREKSKTNPYGICTRSIYTLQGKKRNKIVDCDINYNYEKIPIEKIRALAKERKVSIYNKNKNKPSSKTLSKKKTLINRLYNSIRETKKNRYYKLKSKI